MRKQFGTGSKPPLPGFPGFHSSNTTTNGFNFLKGRLMTYFIVGLDERRLVSDESLYGETVHPHKSRDQITRGVISFAAKNITDQSSICCGFDGIPKQEGI
jgi:hypothetical protein